MSIIWSPPLEQKRQEAKEHRDQFTNHADRDDCACHRLGGLVDFGGCVNISDVYNAVDLRGIAVVIVQATHQSRQRVEPRLLRQGSDLGSLDMARVYCLIGSDDTRQWRETR